LVGQDARSGGRNGFPWRLGIEHIDNGTPKAQRFQPGIPLKGSHHSRDRMARIEKKRDKRPAKKPFIVIPYVAGMQRAEPASCPFGHLRKIKRQRSASSGPVFHIMTVPFSPSIGQP
jgi:hypothetical protein